MCVCVCVCARACACLCVCACASAVRRAVGAHSPGNTCCRTMSYVKVLERANNPGLLCGSSMQILIASSGSLGLVEQD